MSPGVLFVKFFKKGRFRCCCRRGEHRSSAKYSRFQQADGQWPPLRMQACCFRQKTQDFHLIRPVCALGTFPSRGRQEGRIFSPLLPYIFSGAVTPMMFRDTAMTRRTQSASSRRAACTSLSAPLMRQTV